MKKVFFALILSLFVEQTARASEDISVYKKECLGFISRPKVEVYGSYGKLRYNYNNNRTALR